MLNFRNTSALFLLTLLVFNALLAVTWLIDSPVYHDVLRPWSWLFYAIVIPSYFSYTVLMSFFPCSGFHYQGVICKGDPQKMQVTLTFDDGPDAEGTAAVLDILKAHKINAVFFPVGKKIAGNEDLVKRMAVEGHTIGNHSFEHSYWWDFLPGSRLAEDIRKADLAIENATGKAPLYFRPPYGVINPMVRSALNSLPHRVIAWSIRPFDTRAKKEHELLEKTEKKLHPGGIILLHESSAITRRILPELIRRIQSRGYAIVSLEILIKPDSHER